MPPDLTARTPFRNAAIAPSSSPAFGTPAHPFIPPKLNGPLNPTILPVLLPGQLLRQIAFRTFTKRHSLTLRTPALEVLASFIGRKCGAGWREDGLAEKVLDEVARGWKKSGGGVIVEDNPVLASLLKALESCMSGGKVIQGGLSRAGSFSISGAANSVNGAHQLFRTDSVGSAGVSTLDIDDEEATKDLWKWVKVINAFDQPRLTYNAGMKHFDRNTTEPSYFPSPSQKTHLFRHRYNVIQQRLLRHESFQQPTLAPTKGPQRSASSLATVQQNYKITSLSNLLGRNGTSHLVLGLLTISPTGTLLLADLTGSIALDLTHATPIPEDGVWFAPGMIVLVDGLYEEDNGATSELAGVGGVGGAIGGRFIGLTVGGPPCEKREITLGVTGKDDVIAGGGFGWVDFMGVGSERAVGTRMRKIQSRVLKAMTETSEDDGDRAKIVILGEVSLDKPATLLALRAILNYYSLASATPTIFILTGSFVSVPSFASGNAEAGSVAYKELFDALASVLSDFPALLQKSKWIFVPGDNDGWESAFSAGAGAILPQQPISDLFTSRIKRAFASANAEGSRNTDEKGEAIWTTNPARLCLFGPVNEIVIFRDDLSARLRRNAVRFKKSTRTVPSAGDDEIMSDPSEEALLPESAAMDVDSQVQRAESVLPVPSSPPTSTSFSMQPPAPPQITPQIRNARKLVKTLLDQGHLSPFPLNTRPILWDYDSALSLYPLPSLLVLSDSTSPAFTVTYCGCSVINPAALVGVGSSGGTSGKRKVARWIEVGMVGLKGEIKEATF